MATEKRDSWSGNLGFVLATAGSAIGLGNVWKFPYITGLNGGGAFVLVYLCCIFLVGVPLMLCELALGRHTRQNPYGAFKALEIKRSVLGKLIGICLICGACCMIYSGDYGFSVLSLICGILFLTLGFAAAGLLSLIAAMAILSYYAVVGGWILDYVYRSFWEGINFTTPAEAEAVFLGFLQNPQRVTVGFLIFMVLVGLMLWGGVRDGIERWSKLLMPLLFLLLAAVLLRGITLPGAEAGVEFFLKPDFSKLSAGGMLEALGHAFYTLSLGMGITITYGSYLNKNQNLFSAAAWIIFLDTMAATMAGLAIFPAVFAMGFSPSAGPSLIFKILPATFHQMPGGIGWLWAGLFFLMLSIAALTSAAALLESGVTFLVDQFRIRRNNALLGCFTGIVLLGLLSSYSCADWQNIPWMKKFLDGVFGAERIPGSWFDLLDFVTSNWMLPLSGLLIAVFVGWIWQARKAGRELRRGAEKFADENLLHWLSGFRGEPMYQTTRNHGLTLLTLWSLLVRFLAPVVILFIFLKFIGINMGF